MRNSADNVFDGISTGKKEERLFGQFLDEHDFASDTRKAFKQDVRKFAKWFSTVNHEPFTVKRVTTRDIIDFRDHLRRERNQAVSTVNRCLVTLRRLFSWLV